MASYLPKTLRNFQGTSNSLKLEVLQKGCEQVCTHEVKKGKGNKYTVDWVYVYLVAGGVLIAMRVCLQNAENPCFVLKCTIFI